MYLHAWLQHWFHVQIVCELWLTLSLFHLRLSIDEMHFQCEKKLFQQLHQKELIRWNRQASFVSNSLIVSVLDFLFFLRGFFDNLHRVGHYLDQNGWKEFQQQLRHLRASNELHLDVLQFFLLRVKWNDMKVSATLI